MTEADFLYKTLQDLIFDEERHGWIEAISKAASLILNDEKLTADHQKGIVNKLLGLQQYISETTQANEASHDIANRISAIEHRPASQVLEAFAC